MSSPHAAAIGGLEAGASFHRRDDGLVTWATAVAVVFLLVLTNLVINVGMTINHKVETQNSADSVAYSSAVWSARGMNAITATNHLMGELTALYTLHHAFGGKYLDNNRSPNRPPLLVAGNFVLGIDGGIACVCFPIPASFGDYRTVLFDDPIADVASTIFWGKVILKGKIAYEYFKHIQACIGYWENCWNPFAGFGVSYLNDMRECRAEEGRIADEYRRLNKIESICLDLVWTKKNVLLPVLDLLWNYEKTVVQSVNLILVPEAARQVAEANRTDGFIDFAGLPVEQETTRRENRSQLIRASYPWVHFWRKPIIGALALTCPKSYTAFLYAYYTNQYSEENCRDFRRDRKYKLYVLKGLNVPRVDKTAESWRRADQSKLADQLFCTLGFARQRKPPKIFADPFYRQTNPDGVICFAQAMIYNANEPEHPEGSDGDGSDQPKVGWDTLGWTDGAIEHSTFFGAFWPFGADPRIRLAWKAKLVPVTQNRLQRSVPAMMLADRELGEYLLFRLRQGVGAPLQFSPH